MSMFTKRGTDAVTAAQTEKETKESAIVPFGSGTTLKVRVKGVADSVEYYAYSMFGKVNTFVPKEPAERNVKGYITTNPTVWDQAADLLYADANAAKTAGDETKAEDLRKQAYLYKGKPKYLVGFGNLETGADIVVDLTPKQANVVFAAIKKYEKKISTLAFELTKSGSSTNTVVSLSPILDMDEDLTEAERANFAKAGEAPFNFETFESCLYVADEAEQVKNLVIAGFDIGRLGLTYGGSSEQQTQATEPDVGF
ncbi:hypothetical protein [Paenibacillus terrigena]|uniref:hypothetical protein n=1 Tax=Paenibacillus terrigena TaxID=369333 RepID=UPI00036404EF|nr:hypothetical protein [Paenibacillus terrigena]